MGLHSADEFENTSGAQTVAPGKLDATSSILYTPSQPEQDWSSLFIALSFVIILILFCIVPLFWQYRFNIIKYFRKLGSFLWNKDFLLKIALILFILFLIMRMFNIHLTLPSFEPPEQPFRSGGI
jgi:hypothetical protein